jgi:hypothetical protein
MLDSKYFRSGLQRDVDAYGGKAIVEIHLASGRSQRVRSVLVVEDGYVVLEAYANKAAETSPPEWMEAVEGRKLETERSIVAYESLASVHVTGASRESAPRVGFGPVGR